MKQACQWHFKNNVWYIAWRCDRSQMLLQFLLRADMKFGFFSHCIWKLGGDYHFTISPLLIILDWQGEPDWYYLVYPCTTWSFTSRRLSVMNGGLLAIHESPENQSVGRKRFVLDSSDGRQTADNDKASWILKNHTVDCSPVSRKGELPWLHKSHSLQYVSLYLNHNCFCRS